MEAVRANGVPVEYVIFPDEGHGFRTATTGSRAPTASWRSSRRTWAGTDPVRLRRAFSPRGLRGPCRRRGGERRSRRMGPVPGDRTAAASGPRGELPVAFGPGQNLRFRVSLPPGHSSPILAGGRLHLTGYSESEFVTIALDPETGSELWRAAAARPPRHGSGLAQQRGPPPAWRPPRTRPTPFSPDLGLIGYDGGREGEVAPAARSLRQPLRDGRLADPRRRRRGPGARPEPRFRDRRLLAGERGHPLAHAAAGGDQRPLDAGAPRHAGRNRDPGAGEFPAHGLRGRGWRRPLVGRRTSPGK